MKLLIIGASGQGKVAADIAEKSGYDEIVFFDDREGLTSSGKWTVAGKTEAAAGSDGDVFVAIGDPSARKKFFSLFSKRRIVTLVHPAAVLGEGVEIGEGSIVMAGAVLNPYSRIGKGCIVNTCASVDHDCVLGDFVHVAVGAHVCGTVSVGDNTWIGTGATVINNLKICPDCIIGAGAAVVKDITSPGTYVGVPARLLKGR